MRKTKMISWVVGFMLFFGWAELVWGQTPTKRTPTKVEITDKTFKSNIAKGVVVVIFNADYQIKNNRPKDDKSY